MKRFKFIVCFIDWFNSIQKHTWDYDILYHFHSLPRLHTFTHSLFSRSSISLTLIHTHIHTSSHTHAHTRTFISFFKLFSLIDLIECGWGCFSFLFLCTFILTTHNNYNIISIHKIVFTLCLQSFFYLVFYCVFLLITILSISSLSILLLLIEFVFLHIPTFSSCLVYFNLIIILITSSLSILFPFYFIIPDFRFFHVFHPSCM